MNNMLYQFGSAVAPSVVPDSWPQYTDVCRHSVFNSCVPSAGVAYRYMLFRTVRRMSGVRRNAFIATARAAIDDALQVLNTHLEYTFTEDGAFWFNAAEVRADATLFWLPSAAVRELARMLGRAATFNFVSYEDVLASVQARYHRGYMPYRYYAGYLSEVRAGIRVHRPIGYNHFTVAFAGDF